MASTSNYYHIEDKLCSYIQRHDTKNVEILLFEGKWTQPLFISSSDRGFLFNAIRESGANATKVTSNGRSAIGFAASQGATEILRILLRSCEANSENDAMHVAPPRSSDRECENKTPDGMENLLWEEEIQENNLTADDEWSKLYMYVGRDLDARSDLVL